MQYITTTELRTKSSQLIEQLQQGNEISLVHRSKLVGVVVPAKQSKLQTMTAGDLQDLRHAVGLQTSTTPAERDRRYRNAMERKHAKPGKSQ